MNRSAFRELRPERIPDRRCVMLPLTKQAQQGLALAILLLLTGLAVKVWRTSHPPDAAGEAWKKTEHAAN